MWLVVVGIAIAAFAYFAWRSSNTTTNQDELLRRCHGDRAQAERLLALEQREKPGISREQAAKAAAYRLRRDA